MNHQKREQIKGQIAQSEGFPLEKIDAFVTFIGDSDDPYITDAGLQWKCDQKFGVRGYSVKARFPGPEEYVLARQMAGLKDSEPLVVMVGEVWVVGVARPFSDIGTASPKNLKGFVKFSDYPIEMASRRATNRAMRLATASGMSTIDDPVEDAETARSLQSGADPNSGQDSESGQSMPETAGKAQNEKTGQPSERVKKVAEMKRILKSGVFTDQDRAKAEEFLRRAPSEKEIEDSIFHLKETARTRAQKKNQIADLKKRLKEFHVPDGAALDQLVIAYAANGSSLEAALEELEEEHAAEFREWIKSYQPEEAEATA